MRRTILLVALLPLVFAGRIPFDHNLQADAATRLVQDYPCETVRIVEPFGAGGGPDLLARALAPPLSEQLGQAVNVENIIGAGATASPEGEL